MHDENLKSNNLFPINLPENLWVQTAATTWQ